MKPKTTTAEDLQRYTHAELADALVFPATEPLAEHEKQEQEHFWAERRAKFENRSVQEQIYTDLLQLRFRLEDYIQGDGYEETLDFGYFLNEYIRIQRKKDKVFAQDVDVKPYVLSQYLNGHRNPTDKFIIRLELHSNGLIPALLWFRLLQKEKEFEIAHDPAIRKEENQYVKNKIELVLPS